MLKQCILIKWYVCVCNVYIINRDTSQHDDSRFHCEQEIVSSDCENIVDDQVDICNGENCSSRVQHQQRVAQLLAL